MSTEFDLSKFSEGQKKLWDDLIAYLDHQTLVDNPTVIENYKASVYAQIKAMPLEMVFVLKLDNPVLIWKFLQVAAHFPTPEGTDEAIRNQAAAQYCLAEGAHMLHKQVNDAAERVYLENKEAQDSQAALAELNREEENK